MAKAKQKIDLAAVLTAAKGRYRLNLKGIHGPAHWQRVRENGLRLAKSTKADPQMIELFAFLHDCAREDDGADPEHGPRAAEFAVGLREELLVMPDEDFDRLYEAIHDHAFGRKHRDPFIATCWDADRLDIGRVGRKPNPKFLSTDEAKKPAVLTWAWKRSRSARK